MRSLVLRLILLVTQSVVWAEIADNGPWTYYNQEVKDDNGAIIYNIFNGKLLNTDSAWSQKVNSARMMPLLQNMTHVLAQDNVKLVNQIFSERDFDDLFPERFHPYKYDDLLRAIAQFPAFCNEWNEKTPDNNFKIDDGGIEITCRRELATLFAHIISESGYAEIGDEKSFTSGLSFRQEHGCRYYNFDIYDELSIYFGQLPENEHPPKCLYHDTTSQLSKFFPAKDTHYFGRGALQLRWSSTYGRFSKAFYANSYKGFEIFLDNPYFLIAPDPQPMFSSALWLYMTPQFPKTSAHQLITGFYVPDDIQKQYGVGSNFGSTIDVLGQTNPPESVNEECQPGIESPRASLRGEIYSFLLEFFKLESETQLECSIHTNAGTRDELSFWDQGTYNSCKAVSYPTLYSVYNPEDYKRCVCDAWSNGEQSCPQNTVQMCWWYDMFAFEHQQFDETIQVKGGKTLTTIEKNYSDSDYESFLDTIICFDLLTASQRRTDFIALELIQDNLGLTANNTEFRQKYQNTNDTILGAGAPQNMYIATSLGQQTLAYYDGEVRAIVNGTLHHGEWLMRVRPCIDRTQEDYGRYDCAYTNILWNITIEDLCQNPDSSNIPECSEDVQPDEPDEPDPVDSVPVDPIEPVDPNKPDQQENSAPILLDFDANAVIEVQQGAELQLELSSKVFDLDGDDVSLSASLPNNMKPWASFMNTGGIFTLKPTNKTRSGLWRDIKLVLDDSKVQTEYFLNFWVNETEPEPIQQPGNEDEGEESDTDDEDKDNVEPGKKIDNPGINEQEKEKEKETVREDDEDMELESEEELFDYDETAFDPATLWAMKELRSRMQRRKKQIPPEIMEERENMPEPEVAIKTISQIGQVQLLFDQPMLMDDVFSSFNFESEKEDTKKRQLQNSPTNKSNENKKVDLERFIYAYVKRGDIETSADRQNLGFDAYLTHYTTDSIFLKLEFNSPLSVSIGDKPDNLIIAFRASELFVSEKSGKSILNGSFISMLIPKQFPSQSAYDLAVTMGSTVQAAANTAFLSQFGVTICLAVSLKAMWNLMHTMQLVAYLRFVVKWPANASMMLLSMHNAITLDNLINSVYDSILDDFNQLVSKDDDSKKSQLEEKDIFYNNWWMSIGIFGIFLALLLSVLLFYLLLNLLAFRYKCQEKIRSYLRSKLFYSVWIRYMIESYLEMTHSCVFYLSISAATFASSSGLEHASFYARIALLVIFVVWPFFVAAFLLSKRGKLDSIDFKRKFISMYSGLKINKIWPLFYTFTFCLRRILLVCALLALQGKGAWLILAFNALQSCYLCYMIYAQPHEGSIHNRLEYFNEICLIAMQYLMIFFIPGGVIAPEDQWMVGNISMGLLAFLFLINLIALLFLSVNKLILWSRIKRAKKLRLKLMEERRQKRLKKKQLKVSELQNRLPEGQIDDAREMSQIIKDYSESDLPCRLPIESLLQEAEEEEKSAKEASIIIYNEDKIPVPRIRLDMMNQDSQYKRDSSRNVDTAAGYSEMQMTEQRLLPSRLSLISPRDPFLTDLRRGQESRSVTNIDLGGGNSTHNPSLNEQKQQPYSPINVKEFYSIANTPRMNRRNNIGNAVMPASLLLDEEQKCRDRSPESEDYRKYLDVETNFSSSKVPHETNLRINRVLAPAEKNLKQLLSDGSKDFMYNTNKRSKQTPRDSFQIFFPGLPLKVQPQTMIGLPQKANGGDRRISRMHSVMSPKATTPSIFTKVMSLADTRGQMPGSSRNHTNFQSSAEKSSERRNVIAFDSWDIHLRNQSVQTFLRNGTSVLGSNVQSFNATPRQVNRRDSEEQQCGGNLFRSHDSQEQGN